MTKAVSTKQDINVDAKTTKASKRNKRTDNCGYRYDRRKGFWTALDGAVQAEGEKLDSWLTEVRV